MEGERRSSDDTRASESAASQPYTLEEVTPILTSPSQGRTSISERPVPATSLPQLPAAIVEEVEDEETRGAEEPAPVDSDSPQVFHSWDDYPPLPGAAQAGIFTLRYWKYQLRMLVGLEGSRTRKDFINTSWRFAWCLAQIAISLTFLILSALRPSHKVPSKTEWQACNRPLGPWTCIWVARLVIGGVLIIWAYQRRQALQEARRPPASANNAITPPSNTNTTATPTTGTTPARATTTAAANRAAASRLPFTRLYMQLYALVEIGGFVWWLITQIIFYFGADPCRSTSPHLYYLVGALIIWVYVKNFMLTFVLLWLVLLRAIVLRSVNSVRRRLGRPVVQPAVRINAAVRRLSKETVGRIPLVTYIPARDLKLLPHGENSTHAYPPPPSPSPSPTPQATFNILSLWNSSPWSRLSGDEWEDQWEKGSHPFIQLTDDHATCPICFDDYKQPRRKNVQSTDVERGEKSPQTQTMKGGEELRLLDCGHVFHQTCLDPWLTGVSGRCPVCQRAVDVDGFSAKSRAPAADDENTNSRSWFHRMVNRRAEAETTTRTENPV